MVSYTELAATIAKMRAEARMNSSSHPDLDVDSTANCERHSPPYSVTPRVAAVAISRYLTDGSTVGVPLNIAGACEKNRMHPHSTADARQVSECRRIFDCPLYTSVLKFRWKIDISISPSLGTA